MAIKSAFRRLMLLLPVIFFYNWTEAASSEEFILSPSTTMKTGTKDYLPPFLAGKRVDKAPRITYVVELSTAMKAALHRYDPEFKVWKQEDYDPYLVRVYNFTPFQSPSAVFGDFNGDKTTDVVMMGYNKTDSKTIVILSKGDKYTVSEIAKRPLTDPATPEHKIGGGNIIEFLAYVPPGKIKARPEYNRPELNLKSDAFEIAFEEKSASIWLYKDGGFVSYTMSD